MSLPRKHNHCVPQMTSDVPGGIRAPVMTTALCTASSEVRCCFHNVEFGVRCFVLDRFFDATKLLIGKLSCAIWCHYNKCRCIIDMRNPSIHA